MHKPVRDQLDRKILALLEEDARMSATDLARKLGAARSTVTERIARLERDQVIIGYSAIVSMKESESQTRAILNISCERRQTKAVVAGLRNLPEVRYCHAVSGEYDLMCHVETPCAEDLDALLEEIGAARGVVAINATLILAVKFCRAPNQNQTMGDARLSLVS